MGEAGWGQNFFIMAINYSLSLRGNPTDPEADKLVYATAQQKDVLDINAFAEHIVTHGCVYSKGDIVAILTMAVSCIRENLLMGNAIQLGDLGKFWLALRCKGAADYDSFTTAGNIKSIRCKWTAGSDLKDLIKEAEFERVLTKKDEAKAKKDAYK